MRTLSGFRRYVQPTTVLRCNLLNGGNYTVYTTDFDEEVHAEDLAEPAELERLRAYLDQQLDPLKGAVSRLANRAGRASSRAHRNKVVRRHPKRARLSDRVSSATVSNEGPTRSASPLGGSALKNSRA